MSLVDPFGLSPESTQDQGKTSKYEKLHNLLGTIGIFFDGADLINGFVYLAEKDYGILPQVTKGWTQNNAFF